MPHGFLKDFKSKLSEIATIVLGLATAMAIQQVQKVVLEIIEKLRESCPPPEELEKLTQKINNVRQVVNGIQSKADKIKALPQYLQPAILATKIIVDILSHLPIPGTIGTPPGPAGGVIYSEPMGMAATRASKLTKFQKFIETLEDDVQSINVVLGVFQGVFVPILAALNLIEGLIAQCASNQSLTDEERRKLIQSIQGNTSIAATEGVLYTSKNLNNLPYPATTEDQKFKPGFRNVIGDTTSTGISVAFGLEKKQPGSLNLDIFSFDESPSTVANLLTDKRPTGNTYLIKIVNDPTAPDIAPRRQAIVQDFRGVTVLQGPVSFASRPEILIEEMKFRIDNQLP
jgi:hypothetical protein